MRFLPTVELTSFSSLIFDWQIMHNFILNSVLSPKPFIVSILKHGQAGTTTTYRLQQRGSRRAGLRFTTCQILLVKTRIDAQSLMARFYSNLNCNINIVSITIKNKANQWQLNFYTYYLFNKLKISNKWWSIKYKLLQIN